MRKYSILFIFLITMFFISCKKDNNDIKTSNSQNPTSYLLKRQTWTGSVSNGQSILYVYNGDNLVSKIEKYEWGTYSTNGGTIQTWYDTTFYSFEYTNGLCTKWIVGKEGTQQNYFVYEYNNDKMPVKLTYYSTDNIALSYYLYKYDNSNNLIQKIDSTQKVEYRYEYSYDSDNNLASLIEYTIGSNPQRKSKYEWLTYDKKVSFLRTVNGLPVTFGSDFDNPLFSSPNNYLSEKYYTPVNIDQSFGTPEFRNATYEYNDEGLPTKMSDSGWIVNFEYQKYK